jgi:hypothetical protein
VAAAQVIDQWNDFGVAVAGASAALAGLLVVAVSINIERILQDDHLPSRAAGALVTLVAPLVVCVVLLVPGLSTTMIGVAVVAIGVICGALLARLYAPSHRPPQRSWGQWLANPVLPAAVFVLPVVFAGATLVSGTLGGLYWLPVAVIASVVGGLMQAWVLLIEILR